MNNHGGPHPQEERIRGLRIGRRVFLDGVSSDNLKECGLGLGYGVYHVSLHSSESHIQEINSSDL